MFSSLIFLSQSFSIEYYSPDSTRSYVHYKTSQNNIYNKMAVSADYNASLKNFQKLPTYKDH